MIPDERMKTPVYSKMSDEEIEMVVASMDTEENSTMIKRLIYLLS